MHSAAIGLLPLPWGANTGELSAAASAAWVQPEARRAWLKPCPASLEQPPLPPSLRLACPRRCRRLLALSNGACIHTALMPDRPLERAEQLLVSNIAVATFPNSIIGSQDRAFLFATDSAAPFRLWWWSAEEGAVNVDATDAAAVVAHFAAADPAEDGAAASEPGGTWSIPSCTGQAAGWHCGLVGPSCFSHPPIHPPTHPSLTHSCRALCPGAGSATFSYAAGEHSHRFLPGCWANFIHVQPEQQKRWGHSAQQQQQQQQRREEVLVVAHVQLAPTSEAGLSPGAARQEQDQQQESTALPAALASPFPALHAGSDGAAVLASENKYWQVLSREEHQQLWRLPPAAPAFASWLLQEQALPQLAAAVLAAWTNSSSGACTGAGGVAIRASCAALVPLLNGNVPKESTDIMRLAAQLEPALDEQEMRSRLAYSGSSSPRGSWVQLLTLAVWASVSAWLQLLVSCGVATAQWHVTRRATAAGEDEHSLECFCPLGRPRACHCALCHDDCCPAHFHPPLLSGLLLLLVHQLLLAGSLVGAVLLRWRWVLEQPGAPGQQGPAAPSSQLQPALLAWLAQLPSSVPQQARALARSASRLGTRWPAALLLILAVSRVLDAAFSFKYSKRHWNCPCAGQASAGRVWHPCWLKAFKTRWQHCNGCPPPTAAAG